MDYMQLNRLLINLENTFQDMVILQADYIDIKHTYSHKMFNDAIERIDNDITIIKNSIANYPQDKRMKEFLAG